MSGHVKEDNFSYTHRKGKSVKSKINSPRDDFDWKTIAENHTVDGRNPANQLRLVVYPIIYWVLYTSQVIAGFLPSAVVSHSCWRKKCDDGQWYICPHAKVRCTQGTWRWLKWEVGRYTALIHHLESTWRNSYVLVLSWPLTNPPFGSCDIYFHHGVDGR